MKSLLEALYAGEITPWQSALPKTDEHQALLKKIENEEHYFSEKMSSDDYKRFQSLEDLLTLADHLETADIYARGFALGTLLMQEVMALRERLMQ